MSKAKAQEKNTGITFQFKAIELIGSEMHLPKDSYVIETYKFDITTEVKLNPENKIVIIEIGVIIFDEKKGTHLGGITVANIFYIENYNDIVTSNEKNEIDLPESIVVMLNSISLSTTRGVMWNTFKGTFLHDAVLPVLDPKLKKE